MVPYFQLCTMFCLSRFLQYARMDNVGCDRTVPLVDLFALVSELDDCVFGVMPDLATVVKH